MKKTNLVWSTDIEFDGVTYTIEFGYFDNCVEDAQLSDGTLIEDSFTDEQCEAIIEKCHEQVEEERRDRW